MSINVETFILGGYMTNTYVVEDTETGDCAVVDPATGDEMLIEYIKNKRVKYILLTHGHFDHIMGVPRVKRITDAKIVIHKEDEDCFTNGEKSLMAYHFPDEKLNISADIVVSDGDTLEFGNDKIDIMHTPGHTRGGVCYIFNKDRIIFSGDTLFKLSVGRTDFIGGNPREELMSLSKIAKLSGDYVVYPGHGESTTLQYERDNNRYVKIR